MKKKKGLKTTKQDGTMLTVSILTRCDKYLPRPNPQQGICLSRHRELIFLIKKNYLNLSGNNK